MSQLEQSEERPLAGLMSIVVPMYNECANIEPLWSALVEATEALRTDLGARIRWQFVFVNDGSTDESLLDLVRLAKRDDRIRVIDLSRNFGKEIALTAGVENAEGEVVILLDADLQHPPSLLGRFLAEWQKGADVVIGKRTGTEQKSLGRRLGSFLYYRFAATEKNVAHRPGDPVEGLTDFRLLDRSVVEAMKHMRERQRLFRGLVDWLGFRRAFVPFDAPARFAGVPTYSNRQLWNLAVHGIVSQTHFPLRFVLYLGVLTCTLSAFGLAWMFFGEKFVGARWHYTPLAQAMVFNIGLLGILQISIGIVGLYVAKIHQEVVDRPLYVVRRVIEHEASIPESARQRAASKSI